MSKTKIQNPIDILSPTKFNIDTPTVHCETLLGQL